MKTKTVELTKRELQVIKLICRQLSNKEIADKLGLKERTIEDYRAQVMTKVKARNAVGIALYAVKNGLFTP